MSSNFSFHKFKNIGLTNDQVKKQLQNYGNNILLEKKPPSNFYFLIKQLYNPLIIVLFVASVITVLLQEYSDTIVIFIAILTNTILSFVQEKKAFNSFKALKKIVKTQAWVVRNSKKIRIDTKNLTVGDIVVLYEGDKVPADGILIENHNLLLDEVILTGESLATNKVAYSLNTDIKNFTKLISYLDNQEAKLNQDNLVSMGTTIMNGSGKMFVTKVGMQTTIGQIATDLDENKQSKTPLEKKLDHLAKVITISVVILSLFIFFIGIVTNKDFTQMLSIAVALSVASIPEGLVVGLTAILTIGMHRILKRNGLVKSLLAAETLGGVTTVCIDKTGTLTQGKMQITYTKFTNFKLAFIASTLANDLKDPIELARWQWALKQKQFNPEKLLEDNPKDDVIPFSTKTRFLATLQKNHIYFTGAPEELLTNSTALETTKKTYQQEIFKQANQGNRLIGFGYLRYSSTETAQKVFNIIKKEGLKTSKIKWLGIMAFSDPVRNSAAKTIQTITKAGIKIKVITGDFKVTALSIMKKLNIKVTDEEIISGEELEQMSDEELQKRVMTTILFARTKPSQKLRIVKALQKNKEVVGMMGDGVNDAPALAIADVGIVVAEASEVAKESADLILLDSNLDTITASIEEGRLILQNIKKVALYLLSDSFSEIIIVLASLILNWPMAITAVQILWINLIDDGLPSLALTLDPKDKDTLTRKPISTTKKLITKEMLTLIFIISIITAISSLFIFNIHYHQDGLAVAQTMVFALLSIDSLLYVFSCKSLNKNIWHKDIWRNKWLIFASLAGVSLTVLSVHLPILQRLLKTVPLTALHWTTVFITSILVILIIELIKLLFKDKKSASF